MSISLVYEILLNLFNKFKDFSKFFIVNPNTGEKIEINDNILKNQKLIGENVTQNINIVNINILPEQIPEESNSRKKELLKDIEKEVDKKKGALNFKKDNKFLTKHLSPQKKELVKNIKKVLKWDEEKISALFYALRICDLEDDQRCSGAQELYNKINKSKKKDLIKKMYNFARSGYLEGFLFKHIFEPLKFTNEDMDELLKFFPEAIWINEDMIPYNVILELKKRLELKINNVIIYARGNNNIATLHNALILLENEWKNITSPTKSYMISNHEKYMICTTNAEKVALELQTLSPYKEMNKD